MNQYKILVVDDDYASRLLIKKALQNQGFALTLCSDGLEALEVMDKQKYDLVITDLVMEGLDGIELLEKIKEYNSDVAVLLLTGHASIETAIKAVRLGASDYLVKPINLEELRLRIRKAIERLELERKLKVAERKLTFNATVARANHEINQPLTVIISATDMVRLELQKMGITNSKVNNYLELMNKASLRIANILRKMREITTPKIQKIPHGMEMIELELKKGAPLIPDNYILIIDDEENVRKIAREVLEAEKMKVILAQNAWEGVEIYRKDQNNIGLIILDYNLPDAEGTEVIQRLRKIDPNVKILLTSGFDVGEKIQNILPDENIAFMGKPFNREELLNNVRHLFSYQSKSY